MSTADRTDALEREPASLEAAVASDEVMPDGVVEGPGWAVIRLGNGEKRNAISMAGWINIKDLFTRWARAKGPMVVVIRGNGSGSFSAGADISEFRELRLGLTRAEPYNHAVSEAVDSVASYPYPVIGMVNGIAVGGGCELAAACDVRVAAEDSKFGLPITRLGVILGVTETQVLLRLLGPARLKWLVFSGELISAREALEIGLVETVTDRNALVAETVRVASSVLEGAPETVRATKYLTDLCWARGLTREVEEITRLTLQAYESPGLRSRIEQFMRKGNLRENY